MGSLPEIPMFLIVHAVMEYSLRCPGGYQDRGRKAQRDRGRYQDGGRKVPRWREKGTEGEGRDRGTKMEGERDRGRGERGRYQDGNVRGYDQEREGHIAVKNVQYKRIQAEISCPMYIYLYTGVQCGGENGGRENMEGSGGVDFSHHWRPIIHVQ
jgi:hypothetical protein